MYRHVARCKCPYRQVEHTGTGEQKTGQAFKTEHELRSQCIIAAYLRDTRSKQIQYPLCSCDKSRLHENQSCPESVPRSADGLRVEEGRSSVTMACSMYKIAGFYNDVQLDIAIGHLGAQGRCRTLL